MKYQVSAAVFVLLLSATCVQANEETELLRQQIKQLEARLEAIEKREQRKPENNASATAAPLLSPVRTAPKENTNSMEASYKLGKGLQFRSEDNRYQVRVGGYFQADNHTFVSQSNPPGNTDQFFIRSARPIIEAKFDNFSTRFMLDFGNGQSTLIDAYGDYNADKALNLRVGKFKLPLGIERWMNESNVLFTERGMTTNLVPYRDNGIEIYGEIIPSVIEYQLALTNGAPDLVNSTGATDNDQMATARLFTHPFYKVDSALLKGFGIGLAGSYGRHNATLANPNLTTGYVTPAGSRFFTYSPASFASGDQWRLNPQATYYQGPFGFITEYVVEGQGVHAGSKQADLQNQAWEAMASYVLTGEKAAFDGVIPKDNFDYSQGKWGAFEVVGRISQLDIDNNAFNGFASLASSSKAALEASVGGTWYLNPAVKLNLDYAVTQFDGGAAGNRDRKTEQAILSRTQVKF